MLVSLWRRILKLRQRTQVFPICLWSLSWVRTERLFTHLESSNLFLNIILQEIPISLLKSTGQFSQFLLELLLVEYFWYANATSGTLRRVGWSDWSNGGQPSIDSRRDLKSIRLSATLLTALSCCANRAFSQLYFLKTIDQLVKIKYDMCTIAYVDSASYIFQSLGLQIIQLLEEGWDVNDDTRSDEVDTILILSGILAS